MNAVIYARFSSSNQREESIEGQVRECSAYAMKKGYKIIETYADKALSGTTDKRPEFQRMIHDSARRTFEVVICWKHDRFARNRYDAALYKAKLKNNNVKIEYAAEPLSEGAESIILDSVLEGYAEYYSANLSENVKRGLYDSALKRQTLGQYCFGYKPAPDGTYMFHEKEAPAIKKIFEDYINGVPSVDIAEWLNSQGFVTQYGNSFRGRCIPPIIKNPKYKGLYQYGDIVDPNGIPALVTPEMWEKANEMLAKNKHSPNANDDYILTGKLFCGHCGKAMVAGGGKSKTGRYYQYYQCKTKDKKPVPKDYIEKIVIDKLIEIIHSDAMIEEFADAFLEWQSHNDNTKEIAVLENRIKALEKEKQHLISAIKKGLATDIIIEELNSIQDKINADKEKMEELKYEKPLIERDMVIWYLERFREGDEDDPEWRKYLVRDFLQAVYLFDDGHLILQLNYSGQANTISLDLIDKAESSLIKDFSPPSRINSNILCFDGYLLYVPSL